MLSPGDVPVGLPSEISIEKLQRMPTTPTLFSAKLTHSESFFFVDSYAEVLINENKVDIQSE